MNAILVAAIVLLWVVVFALGAVVLGLARQVGVLLERVAPAGALDTGAGLEPGSSVPELRLETIDGSEIEIGGPDAQGRSRLLFFLSPTCPMCDSLLPVVKDLANAEREWLDVVLASDGPEEDHARFIERKGLGAMPYVVSEGLGRTFRVAQLPYGALVDEEGRLAAAGLTNSREHLESLIEAKRSGHASIQSYLHRDELPTA